jgi:glycerol-3-phosphate acyltransferase PlsX
MRIAVDAMGGDHGPSVVVAGALDAARAFGVEISLVGRQAEIEKALQGKDRAGLSVDIIDAEDVIGMEESPAMAVRRKPKSSISTALREVKEGRAGAMVSTGHSGAVMAGSLAILGRIRGVERPALAGVLPTFRGATIMVDLGAVTDPTPFQLVQFAHMAKVYSEAALGKVNPSIALLSNGEEASKGNQLVQEAYPLLKLEPGLNFIGNAEGADILPGEIDVIVTDGFTGNVALKSMEGTFTVFSEIIREEMTRNLPRKLAAFALKPAFRSIRNRLDYAEIGGAPLLGVNGVVIIAHGRSNERAVMNAVGAGKRSAEQELPRRIKEDLTAETETPALEDRGGRHRHAFNSASD